MAALTLRPHAKINLTLRVGPVRADGFHDVVTIMQTIDLRDTLTIAPVRGSFSLNVRRAELPADSTNLVWRAAAALWEFAGRPGEPQGARITLDKQIPFAAGLGGGSADAAAALVGLNKVWDLRLSLRALASLASTLGADVPFFLVGGTGLGMGNGSVVLPLEDVLRLGVIVMKPDFGVNTAEAYRWLDEDRAAGVPSPGSSASEVPVGWPAAPLVLANDLQPPVARRHPAITEAIDACLAQGALGAAMSGSGSAVFGVFSARQTAAAARRLRRPGWQIFATRTLARRESGRLIGL